MEKQKYIHWDNLAREKIELRYPEIELQVIPSDRYRTDGLILLRTFVKDKNSNYICLIESKYRFDRFKWEMLEHFKNRFDKLCKRHIDNYIFNKDTAIQEPYETLQTH